MVGGQRGDMLEMRRMIGQLSREVQTLQHKARVEARAEIPKGGCEIRNPPEGEFEDDIAELRRLKILFMIPWFVNSPSTRFHGFRQRDMSAEEYTTEFYTLSIRVGLNGTDEQLIARYVYGVKISIRDEMGLCVLVI
ncbi:hypothetical protein M9H77_24226 [Catharanthus roseus]|uniref:Uncharacterized protein n=1 Tax=Catharanthus roseus TaxID=4058 RepID=A0ACC0AV87_CATRO|nr:hypothetical protein M9H77_24226 [Catharanthus roseus]